MMSWLDQPALPMAAEPDPQAASAALDRWQARSIAMASDRPAGPDPSAARHRLAGFPAPDRLAGPGLPGAPVHWAIWEPNWARAAELRQR